MFTGIIQAMGEVADLIKKEGLTTFIVTFPEELLPNLKQGASVAFNGTCLTVTHIDQQQVTFDAIQETLQLTTLGEIQKGDRVNLERSFKFGEEVGGHILSGHVHGKAKILAINKSTNNRTLTFQPPPSLMNYIFPKGFIALDGASLTIVAIDKTEKTFTVSLIPETLRVTTFRNRQEGDFVNIEIDSQTQAIVDTVERVLEEKGISYP